MPARVRSAFVILRVAVVLSVFLAMTLSACNDDGSCISEGAVRIAGVCKCPVGTRYVQNRAAKIDRCESDVGDASVAADAAWTPPKDGLDAAVDGSRDAAALKPDREVLVPSAGDAQVPSASDAQVTTTSDAQQADRPVADANVQGGNVLPADLCPTNGALRCVMPGTAARQRCDAGQWTTTDSCASGEVCDAPAPSGAVTCRPVVEVCKGSADNPACDGSTMVFCGKTGFADRTAPCESKLQCEVGLARGACAACLPGAFRCTGAMLEKCSVDGQKYEAVPPACSSAALCNAQAGACTASACVAGSKTCRGDILQTCNATLTGFDEQTCGAGLCDGVGKQCDVCVPSTKSCDGNSVKSCNAQGQGFDTVVCDPARPFCTGNGSCVQCRQPADCAPVGECSVATCNTATGSCGSMFKASGTPCSAGICDGKGVCGPAPFCGDGVKNQPSEECDDGNKFDQDDCLNNCKTARCGDGVANLFGSNLALLEECEPNVNNWTKWNCSMCKQVTIYNRCTSSAECTAPENCSLGFCSRGCTPLGGWGSQSTCPAPPGPLVAWCNNGVGICQLTECKTNVDCPSDFTCGAIDFGGVQFKTLCAVNSQ